MTVMFPLVSIIINNYNYGRFLDQCITSALQQTYKNIQVIVVDDGSTDDSAKILAVYRDKMTVVLKSNGGQASAFNTGIERATGDFILLLDSDDYLYAEAVEICVNEFPAGYSRVYYRLRTVDGTGSTLSAQGNPEHFTDFDGDVFAEMQRSGTRPFFSVPTSANFFSASKLKSIAPVPEKEYRICADSFVLAWTALTGPVKSIDKVLGAYRIHGDNSFSSQCFNFLDSRRLIIQIENYYRSRSLVNSVCRIAGVDYVAPAEVKSLHIVHCLCVAHRLGANHSQVDKWNKVSLLNLVRHFLWVNDIRAYKRIAYSIYLSSILLLPKAAALALIEKVRSIRLWKDRLSE